jgi:rhamnosyl/mannosyltransferase
MRVLAIGRLTYYKGIEYLIRAAAENENIEVHLVGKGDREAKLKALTRELKLEKRVIFHGHLPNEQLATQFSACDCLCLPSIERTEAFGMVLLEAMYYGKATVICNVPGSGMGWVVDDGVNGMHVPPENSGALADSIRNLQQNRVKILRLGENGRQKFDRQFHIDKSATGVSELYKSVLENIPASQQQAKP